MTNEPDTNHSEIERRLKKARLVGPTPALKTRVMDAAQAAWNETSAGTLWRIALGRLAAAAVAALIIVSFADYLSNRVIARWQPRGRMAAATQSCSVDEFPEISFGPFFTRVAALPAGARRDACGTLTYREKVQEMLLETEPGGPADTPAPAEGRSRLPPARPGLYYS